MPSPTHDGSVAYFVRQFRDQLATMPWASPYAMAIGSLRAMAGDPKLDDATRVWQLRNALAALDVVRDEQRAAGR